MDFFLNFLQFLVIKFLDPDPQWPDCWIRIRTGYNATRMGNTNVGDGGMPADTTKPGKKKSSNALTSVADPEPNPDPYVFWPPGSGSGSISQRYGSRSGSGDIHPTLDFNYSFSKLGYMIRQYVCLTKIWSREGYTI
jgi:hypothetical protein